MKLLYIMLLPFVKGVEFCLDVNYHNSCHGNM